MKGKPKSVMKNCDPQSRIREVKVKRGDIKEKLASPPPTE